MKRLFAFGVCVLMTAAATPPQAPGAPDLEGTWRGRLQVDAQTALTVQFVFTRKEDGGYAAVVNSLGSDTIRNVAVSRVSLKEGTLALQVPELQGSYQGVLQEGSFKGKWSQPGSVLPLVLSPYQTQISKADQALLMGSWEGVATLPGQGSMTLLLQLRVDEKGKVQGTLSSQGNLYPVADVGFAEGRLTLTVPPLLGELTATYAQGELQGIWKQQRPALSGVPITFKKGVSSKTYYALRIPGEAVRSIMGSWSGELRIMTLKGEPASQPVTLRFDVGSQAQMRGCIDQPGRCVPITDASLSGSKLVVESESLKVRFTAILTENTLTGTWTQANESHPLTLTRK